MQLGSLPAELLPTLESVLRDRLGHRVPERRLEQIAESVSTLAHESGYPDLGEYLALARTLPVDAPLVQSLVRTVTNKESYFFRDAATMTSLREQILPPILERCASSRVLRVWSAGCSTGEELYSLSIVLQELLHDYDKWTVSLVGTDIDESAIVRARRADYKEWSLRTTPEPTRARYFQFDPVSHSYRLRRGYRHNVAFGLHNLADAKAALPTPGTFELIFCRNVLIYFGAEGQADVRRKFRQALSPGGVWIGGPSDPSPGPEWATTVYPGALVHAPEGHKAQSVPRALPPPVTSTIERPRWQDTPRAEPLTPPPAQREPASPAPTQRPAAVPAAIDTEVGLMRALELANRGALTQAREVLSAILQRDPLACDAYLLLATVEQSLGIPDGAIRELRRAIYLDPSRTEAHLRLGLLLAEGGQREAAIRSLRTAVVLVSAQEQPSPDETAIRQTAATQMVRLLREEA